MRDSRTRPPHPGHYLGPGFLGEYGLSVEALASAVGVPLERVQAIVDGVAAVDADAALRFARFFGSSAETWMAIQSGVELFDAMQAGRDSIERITPLDETALPNREPLPDDLVEELKVQMADIDDPTRWMILSRPLFDDEDDDSLLSQLYYHVGSGCWAVGIEGGTAFKREQDAQAVADALGTGSRVKRTTSERLTERMQEDQSDRGIRKRFLRRSRDDALKWDAADYLQSEQDIAAYLEVAAEEGDPTLLAAAVDDVMRVMRAMA